MCYFKTAAYFFFSFHFLHNILISFHLVVVLINLYLHMMIPILRIFFFFTINSLPYVSLEILSKHYFSFRQEPHFRSNFRFFAPGRLSTFAYVLDSRTIILLDLSHFGLIFFIYFIWHTFASLTLLYGSILCILRQTNMCTVVLARIIFFSVWQKWLTLCHEDFFLFFIINLFVG